MDARTDTPTLAERLAARARNRPDALALVAAGRQWRWVELATETAQRATRFRSHLMALPAPRAMLAISGSNLELALATLACHWAGIPVLPLAAETPANRIAELQARYGECFHFASFAVLDGHGAAEVTAPATPDRQATALFIATSGSEGEPKLVALSHAALTASADSSTAALAADEHDCWLSCLPQTHIGGQAILARALASGGTLRLHDAFDADAGWREIATGAVTQISLVPAMLACLLDLADAPPNGLRSALIGGAALSASLRQRALDAGWPIRPSYGMSETAAMIALLSPTTTRDAWKPGLVGKPLDGVELRIDSAGHICIRAPQLMSGYLDAQGQFTDTLRDGWFVTGDRGELDASGQLSVLGRADDMFVSGGVNVHPQEVESQLAACPGIADVAVTATQDPVWGDVLAALIVGPAETQSVRHWCQQHLPSAHRPRRFLRVDSIPRNAMGKPNRAALRTLLSGTPA